MSKLARLMPTRPGPSLICAEPRQRLLFPGSTWLDDPLGASVFFLRSLGAGYDEGERYLAGSRLVPHAAIPCRRSDGSARSAGSAPGAERPTARTGREEARYDAASRDAAAGRGAYQTVNQRTSAEGRGRARRADGDGEDHARSDQGCDRSGRRGRIRAEES